MRDLGLLVLRASVGSLVAGHGAQKLFGAFGGPGLQGTAGMMESLGLQPKESWAYAAGLGEFGGGVLTVLGLCTPLGLLGMSGAMATAATTVHGGKPVWVTSGGAELPLTNLAVAATLALAGPGKFSLDALLGLRVPRWFSLLGLLVMIATVATITTTTASGEEAPADPGDQPADTQQEARPDTAA